MPQKSKRNKISKQSKTRKHNIYLMHSCSKRTKLCKKTKTLGNTYCSTCGEKCNCSHHCPGTCYLRRQKGGSGCGSCGCPLAPYPMKGGVFFKPAGSMPGPIVGSNWGTSLNKWPGINGDGNDRNYLKSYNADNNIVAKDPQLQMSMNDSGYNFLNSMVGGKRKKSRSKVLKGGGLIPQDLVNLGMDMSFNVKSAYNALGGYSAPINPLPYKDQLANSLSNNRHLFYTL